MRATGRVRIHMASSIYMSIPYGVLSLGEKQVSSSSRCVTTLGRRSYSQTSRRAVQMERLWALRILSLSAHVHAPISSQFLGTIPPRSTTLSSSRVMGGPIVMLWCRAIWVSSEEGIRVDKMTSSLPILLVSMWQVVGGHGARQKM